MTKIPNIMKYDNIIENITINKQLNEITKLNHKIIIENNDTETRPHITIKNTSNPKTTIKTPNNTPTKYLLPINTNITIIKNQKINTNNILIKIPHKTTKTKNITNNLPHVTKLFETHKPKEHTIISKIDNIINFTKEPKNKHKIIIKPKVNNTKEYMITKNKPLTIHKNNFVRTNETLINNSTNPHDILQILNKNTLTKYLINKIQKIYHLQNVHINNKHIKYIVHQILH